MRDTRRNRHIMSIAVGTLWQLSASFENGGGNGPNWVSRSLRFYMQLLEILLSQVAILRRRPAVLAENGQTLHQ